MKYQSVLENTYYKVKAEENDGQLAKYIPELAKIDETKLGIHLRSIHNEVSGIGDCFEKFSIQSISKVISFSLAYQLLDSALWKRVDVEPAGTPFNSLIQLEADKGVPRNPFINAGAIVICDVLLSELKDPFKNMLDYFHKLSGNKTINYSKTVAESEKKAGYRNYALANFLKSLGNLNHSVDDVLDFYFKLSAIELTCEELTQCFHVFANEGKRIDGEQILTFSQTKRVNALMQTCGFYDEAGEFAFRVGLPGKSGVGGGIIAIHPNKYSIAVWSPKLNPKGNSYRGMKFLEEFTTATQTSIF